MTRWLAPAALFLATALALTFPLVTVWGSALPHDAGDPVLNTWILWWSTRAVPMSAAWWNAPMFFPMSGAMALSELLIGLLPITAPVQWLTGNPVAAYNTAFVLSFPLCALGAYALAHELTARRDVSIVAGVAFAFAPYRMGQLAHVQMLSYYWAPVALLGLHRYLRTGGIRSLVLFATAWLLQALSNGYALFHLSVLIVVWVVWFVRPIRRAVPIAAAWACAAAPLIPLLLHYRAVHSRLHLVRDVNEIRRFGADLMGFVAAPSSLAMWGGRLPAASDETALFPGATLIAIAAAALVAALRRRRPAAGRLGAGSLIAAAVALVAGAVAASSVIFGPWAIGRVLTVTEFHKPLSIAVLATLALGAQTGAWGRAWRGRSVPVFYVAAAALMYVLALGPAPAFRGEAVLYEPPYAWLMRLPGFDVLRVPARFAMLAVLCQSVAVALVLARWSRRSAGWVMIPLVCAGLLVDGWIRLPVATVPSLALRASPDVAAVLELPPGGPLVDFPAIYRSMFHQRPIANGYSGYAPPHYLPLVHAVRDGEYEALREFAAFGPLGVAIDRSTDGADALAASVGSLGDAVRLPVQEGWHAFVLPSRQRLSIPVGSHLNLAGVEATHHPEDLARLRDDSVATAWGAGTEQRGDEEIVVDLGSVRTIGAVVFEMGAFAFGFPRTLLIDGSAERQTWTPVWTGRTAVPTVRAALSDPGTVPVTIRFDAVSARFLRLRQVGRESGIPWWIAELRVLAPPR
jgi:hypothetical protein